MNFRFSFSNKSELIYINDKPDIEPVGSLLKALIDMDWASIESYAMSCFLGASQSDKSLYLETKQALLSSISHGAIACVLNDTSDVESLMRALDRFRNGSEAIKYILESLVDEEQHSYEECLLYLIASEDNKPLKSFFDSLGIANMLPVKERNKPMYHSGEDFPFLFETSDLMTLAIQELQFMCSNRFYIRKCALCKRFIWTRKMNKIYCDRSVSNGKKTCAQIGPPKLWRENNPRAYALYWSYRARLFNRATSEGSDYCFHQWLNQTEVYKNLAKKNAIPYEEMKNVLDEIEMEIYEQAVGL